MVRPLCIARSVLPQKGRAHHSKNKEECARYLQPQYGAQPAKGTQEPAYSSRYALSHLSCGSSRRVLGLPGMSGCASLHGSGARGPAGQPFAGYPPCNPQSDTQSAPNTLRSHSVYDGSSGCCQSALAGFGSESVWMVSASE